MPVETRERHSSYTLLNERPARATENKWWFLPGTGYDVRGQINEFVRDYNQAIESGIDVQLVVDAFTDKASENIRHFCIEYPLQRLVFPIFLDIQQREGVKRLVAPRYNNQVYTDLISEQERKGWVRRSIRQIEEFLAEAEEGSMAILVSPPGWSDLDDRQGGEIIFADNQIYIYKKEKKGVTARTLRTDMDLEESESFLEQFEVPIPDPQKYPTEERIVNIVSSPIFLRSSNLNTFEAVVDVIKRVKREKFAYKNRSFDEILYDLSLREKLLELNQDIQKYAEPIIKEFSEYVLRKLRQVSEDAVDGVEKELGKAILRIHKAIKSGYSSDFDIRLTRVMTEEDYQQELKVLTEYKGCNGGGSSQFIMTVFGPREMMSSLATKDQYGSLEFPCPKCKRVNRRPYGQLMPNCQYSDCQADVRC